MKDEKIEIRISAEQKELIKKWATEEGMTVSAYLMLSLIERLNKKGKIEEFMGLA